MSKPFGFVLVVFAALAVAAGALAAAPTITIDLKGGFGNRIYKACGITHHYILFHPGPVIAIKGLVTPVPSRFRVKLKVKQCVHGTFKSVWVGSANERRDGSYIGAYVPRHRGWFYARAYVHVGTDTGKSNKRYFQVR